jgi:hypothetical protein
MKDQTMGQKPLILTPEQQKEICDTLASGASRTVAARFAGCHPATLRAEIRRNPEFEKRVIKSENNLETVMLRAIRQATESDVKHWRAAAWGLERIFPNRYAKRRSDTLTRDQVHEVISEVSEIVASELPVPRFRQRIFHRLGVLFATARPHPIEPTPHDNHAPSDTPEQQRLAGPIHGNGSDQATNARETPPNPPSESTETTADSQ